MKLEAVAENMKYVAVILILSIIYTSAFVFFLMDTNSIGPDESKYIWIGHSITEGSYPDYFTHRLPIIPGIIALSEFSGLGIHWGRVLIPLIFMNLMVVGTYFFTRSIVGKKEALLSLVFLLSFPFFWRWGLNVLVDIPLAAVSAISLGFFYLGVEKHKKYLLPSAVFFAVGVLLKFSVFLFIFPMIIYLVYRKKLHLLKSEEMIISIVMIPLIFFLVFFMFNMITGVGLYPLRQLTFFENPKSGLSELFKLGFAPTLLFSLIGFLSGLKERKNAHIFLILIFVIFSGFFLWHNALRLRYLALMIPVFAALAGYAVVRIGKTRVKWVSYGLFIILVIIGVFNSLFLVDLEESYQWGVEELSDYLDTLEPGSKIASEYMPYFLDASSNMEVIPVLTLVEFGNRTMEYDRFVEIHLNKSHPEHAVVQEHWTPRTYRKIITFYYDWFVENDVDYFVISLYNEFIRNPEGRHFSPTVGPFTVPFIKRPYSSDRPPLDYEFGSETYLEIEANPNFRFVKDIKKGEQVVLKVYEVIA